MIKPLAFSPGSATLMFLPVHGSTPMDTYAKGFAIALTDGVTASVRRAKRIRIHLNNREITLPPVRTVIERLALEPVEAYFETPLPLGCGFGVSAACTLTTAFALAKEFDYEFSREELARIAHEAEVTSGTGIGDVATQLTGGIVYRRGITGPFDCLSLPLHIEELFYCVFGPISTKEILANPKFQQTLRLEGSDAMTWLEANHQRMSITDLFQRSLTFAERTELLTDPQVRQIINKVQEGQGSATMIMLGQSVLATQCTDNDIEWQRCGIDTQGTRWVE